MFDFPLFSNFVRGVKTNDFLPLFTFRLEIARQMQLLSETGAERGWVGGGEGTIL